VLQLVLAESDHVIRAFSPNTPDHALAIAVLPWRSPGADDLIEFKDINAFDEFVSKDSVSIPMDESGVYVPRKRVRELLRRPTCRRMLGDRDVEYSPVSVIENNENVQKRETYRRHDHEIHCDRFVQVISDESAPGLRRRVTSP
jgi:hypothetical protein